MSGVCSSQRHVELADRQRDHHQRSGEDAVPAVGQNDVEEALPEARAERGRAFLQCLQIDRRITARTERTMNGSVNSTCPTRMKLHGVRNRPRRRRSRSAPARSRVRGSPPASPAAPRRAGERLVCRASTYAAGTPSNRVPARQASEIPIDARRIAIAVPDLQTQRSVSPLAMPSSS